ncbi:hypothetical protein F5Y10DRAFT_282401 [Nemania abortiva]|nr:hypothetical protein F5Y10DRAFT_282401 [Nemania abortiva]
MTRHNVHAHQAVDKSQSWIRQPDRPQHSPMLHEPRRGLTAQAAGLPPSLRSDTHTEPDIAAALIRELGYVEMLHFLGFKLDTSVAILRYWAALKLDASTGGPYDLLGVALGAIAELGELETRGCRGDVADLGKMNQSPRSEWHLAFAQVLNCEALAAVRRAGAYVAPDFAKAKWLVCHMVMRRWERLVGWVRYQCHTK